MDSIFHDFQEFICQNPVQNENKNLNNVFNKFSFHLYMKNENQLSIRSNIDDITNIQHMTDQQIIFISEYIENTNNYDFHSDFFIICINNMVIFLEQTEINKFYHFFAKNKELSIYVFSENFNRVKMILEKTMNLKLKIENSEDNQFFRSEIQSFSQKIQLLMNKKTLKSFKSIENLFRVISETISGYLIQKSYYKLKKYDRVVNYKSYIKERNDYEFNEDEFVVLRSLSNECINNINLIYHIEYEELLVLKIFSDEKGDILFDRERSNYKQINYPFFPKYYGTSKYFSYKCIVIEYIQGDLLENIHNINLDYNIKLKIIFQIMIALQYLHSNGYIYRDLKPNNIIINKKGSITIIDFDRMINDSQNYQFTTDFQHEFIAPEIIKGSSFSTKSDIYSLGKIIEFIITNKILKDNTKLKDMCEKCTLINDIKRPVISQLIDCFYFDFFAKVSFVDESDTIKNTKNIHDSKFFIFWYFLSEYDNYMSHYYLAKFSIVTLKNNWEKIIQYLTSSANHNISKAQYLLGFLYENGEHIEQDINQSIHYYSLAADQNNSEAQYNLGVLYYKDKYIPRNINKSIHYFTLASNQNVSDAQYSLGIIYISIDINKAIHYLTLASNNNNSYAQYILGILYYYGKYTSVDINKAIYYFSLAANQNNSEAQYELGLIYFNGDHIQRDIHKAIHYYSLAAGQNNSKAQYNLGLIYYRGESITRDINKSIHYFTCSANQNNLKAQYNLGVIYERGEFITRDINKSIHYYTLAANQNDHSAQYNLGVLFYDGKYIRRDINKSIYYYSQAAKQNDIRAQFNLGVIYESGKYIKRDINKSIYYYSLASNQNSSNAQYKLGLIYYDGQYISRDINKAIHYFQLSANQNDPNAQFNLGLIYYDGKYIPRDINKAIHYFSLSANQNDSNAQFNLGLIYYDGKYIQRDINKAIHYFSLSANSNKSCAEYHLGLIYLKGENISQNIEKSIYYLSLSANHNNSHSQYVLGLIYLIGQYIQQDINKAIHYLKLSADLNNSYALMLLGVLNYNGYYLPKNINNSIRYFTLAANKDNYLAYFYLGNMYCQGLGVNQDIDYAIKCYKECSSYNHQYSKNNLGILYKNIKRNEIAIEYFEEAIRQKNDIISMYNLGHIYFYGNFIKKDIDKSIELLIKSSNQDFYPSKILLSLAIIKKVSPINIQTISKETTKYGNNNKELNHEILAIILQRKIEDGFHYEKEYSFYENVEYFYDNNNKPVEFSFFMNAKHEKKIQENIKESFYEGFNIKLI